jgi:hypothetical protein
MKITYIKVGKWQSDNESYIVFSAGGGRATRSRGASHVLSFFSISLTLSSELEPFSSWMNSDMVGDGRMPEN